MGELVGPSAVPPLPQQIVGTVGDISFTPMTIHVPGRSFPMAGSVWTVRDQSRTERFMPTWAIICAIVFALACLLGLLFLAVKETRIVGYYDVEVRNGSDYHVTQVPAAAMPFDRVRQIVDHARSLSAWATGQGA